MGFLKKLKKKKRLDAQAQVLEVLRDAGFRPKSVIDVGANKGQWSRKTLSYFPEAKYRLFEPQAELRSSLDQLRSQGDVEIHSIGLGEKKGSFSFTMHDRDDSRSFSYTAEQASELGFEQEDIQVDTLDNFLAERNLPSPDILKVDAEGWDIQVLNGAEKTLADVDVVFVEAGVCNTRITNDLLTTLNYMSERGFSLVDFSDLNRPFRWKLLWLVECTFVKTDGEIFNKIREFQDS